MYTHHEVKPCQCTSIAYFVSTRNAQTYKSQVTTSIQQTKAA